MKLGAQITVAFLALSSCAPEPSRGDARSSGRGRGVLVVVIDALRADHSSGFGYDRETTPELDEFAKKGVVFTQAFSAAPSLLPSHVGLLTGCDPLVARRNLAPEMPPSLVALWHIPPKVPHVAQEFLNAGYDTAAFLDHDQLSPVHGFARGFEHYAEFAPATYKGAQDWGAAGVTRRFREWLVERKASANWFAYLEISDLERVWFESDAAWDTHFAPRAELNAVPPVADAARSFFAIPRQYWSGGMRTLGEYEAEYDGAIRRVDQTLGRLWSELEASGRLDDTTVVITSSRGMGFGEAGLYLDQGTLSDVDLHVPLIVRPARSIAAARGARLDVVVSTIDIAPTLLALERVAPQDEMHGASLARVIAGAAETPHEYVFARCGYQDGYCVIGADVCFEWTQPWVAGERNIITSWYGTTEFERRPREVLHDRRKDPGVGHRHSEPLVPARIVPLRSAANTWGLKVERFRRRAHEGDWLEHRDTLPVLPEAAQ